ncbi:hypothetical protein FG379_002005 [Cryptosporidium bovis]|uniref:uncharacterized protein n=1 Tax=Cryptosporidium bovis TaxID=310047 RepID=UPI003519E1E6|nr:hypothetical protein FG379_002005 [Cryptosporidium bovis]
MNINFYLISLVIIGIPHLKHVSLVNSSFILIVVALPVFQVHGYILPSKTQLFDALVSISSGVAPFRFESVNITREVQYIKHAQEKNETELKLDMAITESKYAEAGIDFKNETIHLEVEDESPKSIGLRGTKVKEDSDTDLIQKRHPTPSNTTTEHVCVDHGKMTYFNPFAETARGVGIPANSLRKITLESNIPYNAVLDSETLLELYYFNYDKYPLKMTSTTLENRSKEWISNSLLSLIYRSEGDESLSFLILSYGVINVNWQTYSFKESHIPELVEEYEDANKEILGDIALNSTQKHTGT